MKRKEKLKLSKKGKSKCYHDVFRKIIENERENHNKVQIHVC